MSKAITTNFLDNKTINGIKINTSKHCSSSNYNSFSSAVKSYIVVHYTGNSSDTAEANANYFMGANRQASAHLFVDEKHIYQSVGLRNLAWSVGVDYSGGTAPYWGKCTNGNSISIEMCTSGNYRVADKTKTNTAYLVAYLCKLIDIKPSQVKNYVVRHYDVCGKTCPAQMATKNNAEWNAFIKQVIKVLKGKEVVKTKDTAILRKSAYVDPVGKTSLSILSIPKGKAVEWLSDDGTGWSKVKYNKKTGYVPNTKLNKKGLSTYKKITITKGKKVYKVLNGTLTKATVLKKPREFSVISFIESGKYKSCYYCYRNRKYYYIKF